MTVQAIQTLQQNLVSMQSVVRAAMNPVYEFPPLDGGILPAKNWTKDLSDHYPGNDGTLYAKYKFTVTNASSIMPGTYAAYANSVYEYFNGTSYKSLEWPPSGAFDKLAANDTNRFPGWHQRDSFC